VIGAFQWRLLASSHDAEFLVSNEVMIYSAAHSFCHRGGSEIAQFKSEQDYKNVAAVNKQKLWIQGGRPCIEKSKIKCGTSDMEDSFVYDDGTKVGVFASWDEQQPSFGENTNILIFEDQLQTSPPTAKLHALCRRGWSPLITVDRVEYFKSVSSSLDYNGAKMFCLRNHGELAHFKLRNEFLNIISVSGKTSLWIDATNQFINKHGTTVGEFADWDTNEPSVCREDRVVLSDGKLKDVSSATHRGGALCERPNRNELNIIGSTKTAMFFASESSKFSANEGNFLCKKLGGELAQFKSEQEWKVVIEKVPNGQFWIAGSRRDNYFVYPDGARVGNYAKWSVDQPNKLGGSGDKVELINGELKVSGSLVGGKVLCRRSTIGISHQEWKDKTMKDLVQEKLDCAGRFLGKDDEKAKRALCEHLAALFTSNTLEDQVNFSLLNKLGFSNYKLIKDLSPKCVNKYEDRRLFMEERGGKTLGSVFRRTEHSGTERYDTGELPGNARTACRDWIAKVDAENGDNLCSDLKTANKRSLEALVLTEHSNRALGNFKTGTAWTKVALAAGYAGVAGASFFTLNPREGFSSALDAAAMMTDAAETFAESAYQYNQAAVNRLEQEAAMLTGKVDEYNECNRPSTAELNCGIGQVSTKINKYLPDIKEKVDVVDKKLDDVDDQLDDMDGKLDKMIVTNEVIKSIAIDIRDGLHTVLEYLPEMDEKLDSLMITGAFIESIALNISNDLRTTMHEVSDLMRVSERLIKYVQHDSEVHKAIQRLDEVYRSSLEGGTDFRYWFAAYRKTESCKNLHNLELFAIRILNYLSRDIHDQKGNLLESCRPISGLTRPELKGEYLAPSEVKLWLQKYNIEWNYLLTLAKFGYSLNVLVHIHGFKKINRDLEELFDHLNPSKDYKDANIIYLQSLNYINSFPTWHDCLSCGERGVNKYSWCKADQISRTYCENCHKHYHEVNDDCVRNTCVCENGQPEEWCNNHKATACNSCDDGYTKIGTYCRKARCRCNYGTPVSPTNCPAENLNKCLYCSRHYRLQQQDHSCVWAYKCTCRNGTPLRGRACRSNGEYCSSCRYGYGRRGNRCYRMLRSGDMIRLSRGCYSSYNFLIGKTTYRIWAENLGRGEFIRFCSNVGLVSNRLWLSCKHRGMYCTKKTCPNRFYSKERRGWTWPKDVCRDEKFGIQNSLERNTCRYVYENDRILLLSYRAKGWLFTNWNKVATTKCPGDSVCGCTSFTLIIY